MTAVKHATQGKAGGQSVGKIKDRRVKHEEDQTSTRNKPQLGAGRTAVRNSKDVLGSELDEKLYDIENKRRLFLIQWNHDVTEMEREMYGMTSALEGSLVRSESARARDRKRRKELEKAKPHMIGDEVENLPVRMRPKPKYERFPRRGERRRVNDRSYTTLMDELREKPRLSALTDDQPSRPPTNIESTELKLPPIRDVRADVLDDYRVLLLQNPFYLHRERDSLLATVRSETGLNVYRKGTNLPPLRKFGTSEIDLSKLPMIMVTSADRSKDAKVRAVVNEPSKIPSAVVNEPSKIPSLATKTQEVSKSMVLKGSRNNRPSSSGTHTSKMTADSSVDRVSHIVAHPVMPVKNQTSLDDPNFRKTLLERLDRERQERKDGSKWSLLKNAMKASSLLQIKMPEVIRQQQLSKQSNRALEQVQERMRAKEASGLRPEDKTRMSQSTGALDKLARQTTSWSKIPL